MSRALIDYLPPMLQEVEDYRAVTSAEDPEITAIEAGTEAVLENSIISTAGDYGLARWERALGLPSTGALEDRRTAVLARTQYLIPYTMESLKKRLSELCGESGYSVSISGLTLTVKISIEARNTYAAVVEMLSQAVPANIVVDVSVKLTTHAELETMTYAQLAGYTHEEIRNEVATGGN